MRREEIRSGRNPAEDGAHVPFGDNARRDGGGGGTEDNAEALLGFDNSETVVAHRKMPRIVGTRSRFRETSCGAAAQTPEVVSGKRRALAAASCSG